MAAGAGVSGREGSVPLGNATNVNWDSTPRKLMQSKFEEEVASEVTSPQTPVGLTTPTTTTPIVRRTPGTTPSSSSRKRRANSAVKKERLRAICPECKSSLVDARALRRHQRKQHGAPKGKTSFVRCQKLSNGVESQFDPGACDCTFRSREQWAEHAREVHGFHVKLQKLHFKTRPEFEHWREQLRLHEHYAFFRRPNDRFVCSLHGNRRRPILKNPDGTDAKITCYAFINLDQLPDGTFEATFWNQHSHTPMKKYEPLSRWARREIFRLAALRWAPQSIQCVIQAMSEPNTRNYAVSFRDIKAHGFNKLQKNWTMEDLASDPEHPEECEEDPVEVDEPTPQNRGAASAPDQEASASLDSTDEELTPLKLHESVTQTTQFYPGPTAGIDLPMAQPSPAMLFTLPMRQMWASHNMLPIPHLHRLPLPFVHPGQQMAMPGAMQPVKAGPDPLPKRAKRALMDSTQYQVSSTETP
ncbi:uncharacterized protein MONBRDRAFT_34756 [Monosiga brevicollis MX1]|uniref:C2H2-type domain-containing protein n=1 Tax=Monosiga brevicollis TaxID=81824 RepID=A9VDV2_MONBE|nr:uncharacterized protein MONBRDRAFT_34756 [Monosiga brevicollis MX1]EDQ84266.1 predicted protein [Monosiga brevicollis MX1]|eukprot:XP_001750896.1 hypothetical protein [Monosiga brevicollis MX1]